MLHIAEDQTLGIDPEHLERSVSYLGDSNYTRGLASKYDRREDMYVWNHLELVSFGGIIALYKFYFYDLRGGRSKEAESVKQLLFPVKALRNAAAHNLCAYAHKLCYRRSAVMCGSRQSASSPPHAARKTAHNRFRHQSMPLSQESRSAFSASV